MAGEGKSVPEQLPLLKVCRLSRSGLPISVQRPYDGCIASGTNGAHPQTMEIRISLCTITYHCYTFTCSSGGLVTRRGSIRSTLREVRNVQNGNVLICQHTHRPVLKNSYSRQLRLSQWESV
jgi:hypothetical protein